MVNAAADKPTANKPIVKKQLGNISVAVFAREVNSPDGKNFTAKDYVLQKSWKDKQGNWQDQSMSLKSREILAVQQSLASAFVESFDALESEDE